MKTIHDYLSDKQLRTLERIQCKKRDIHEKVRKKGRSDYTRTLELHFKVSKVRYTKNKLLKEYDGKKLLIPFALTTHTSLLLEQYKHLIVLGYKLKVNGRKIFVARDVRESRKSKVLNTGININAVSSALGARDFIVLPPTFYAIPDTKVDSKYNKQLAEHLKQVAAYLKLEIKGVHLLDARTRKVIRKY